MKIIKGTRSKKKETEEHVEQVLWFHTNFLKVTWCDIVGKGCRMDKAPPSSFYFCTHTQQRIVLRVLLFHVLSKNHFFLGGGRGEMRSSQLKSIRNINLHHSSPTPSDDVADFPDNGGGRQKKVHRFFRATVVLRMLRRKKGAPFLPGYGGIGHAMPKKRYTISTGLRW